RRSAAPVAGRAAGLPGAGCPVTDQGNNMLGSDPLLRPSVLLARLTALWPWKVLLAVVLNLWVAVPYYTLQHWTCFVVTRLDPTPFEESIPFAPQLAWLYLSLYLLLPIAPLFMTTTDELRRFAGGIAFLGLASNLCFFLMPTEVARDGTSALAGDWLYRFI